MDFPISCSVVYTLTMMVMIMLPILATAQLHHNVPLNSSLFADDMNSTWRSPSGEFGFGFRQVSGGYLLAIMFDEMPDRTIVWSANRGNLTERGSRVQLSANGRLELTNPRGERIWASSFSGPGVAYGAMLDNGNFVLAQNNPSSDFLWQSFAEPTDTLLPGQELGQGGSLLASFSKTNHSIGRFRFSLQTNGNLGLYTHVLSDWPSTQTSIGVLDQRFAYWPPSDTLKGYGSRVIFSNYGYIYLAKDDGKRIYSISSNQVSTTRFHQRLTLDYDGVLRHYLYPKSANSTDGRPMSWSVNSSVPPNICIPEAQLGEGVCGFNSVCTLEGNDQSPNCSCPTGYSPLDPTDRMGGCKPDFLQQSCDQNTSRASDNFEFKDMPNMNWPNGDYYRYDSVNEEFCRQSCLSDCLCDAVFFGDDQLCWKKGIPLRNGRVDSNVGGKSLLKIRRSNNTRVGPFGGGNSNKSSNNRSSALLITGWALFGGLVFLNLLLFASFLFKARKKHEMMNVHAYKLLPGMNIRSFSFNELREATNGFSQELGSGACSIVYKGVLRDENRKIVAVKKLDKIETEADLEFKAEVSSISSTNHRNLVKLLGYCDEGQNRLLVYEYMQNGSLASFLFGKVLKPNWYQRVQIAFEVARGLCYLHGECTMQIIHCDIKPQNVLLDESHVAKISDFGLAKLLKPDQTRTHTGIRGTRGYVAPEWFRNMPITAKVDVYSFGILLLELLCCRKNYEAEVENECEVILVDWAYDCYMDGTLRDLVADDEVALDDIRRFEKFVTTAIWCVQEDPALRPQMKRVLHMLEGSVEVPAPPDPSSFIN